MATSVLPTPEPPDPVEGMPGHFSHTNWVKASLKALDAAALRNTGDTLTGDLTINPSASEEAHLRLQGNSNLSIWGQTHTGLPRWRMYFGAPVGEAGPNGGAAFSLQSYNDSGQVTAIALFGHRATGLLTVAADPTAPLGIATKQYADASVPIGAIIAYGGNVAPVGWHLCDGTPHNSAALQAVIGVTFAPDLRSKFVVGAGSAYALGTEGGADAITLTGAQSGVAPHNHEGATGVVPALQLPTLVGGTHEHFVNVRQVTGAGSMTPNADVLTAGASTVLRQVGSTSGDGLHSHLIDVPAHAHVIATQVPINATASHENRPPFFALTYIIKKV